MAPIAEVPTELGYEAEWSVLMIRGLTVFVAGLLLVACSPPQSLTISVLGTNDVHGELVQNGDRGGLVTLSAYVGAVRDARSQDGGGVVLIDAGDMWQGTLESNLSEGAPVMAAFNALGYAAAAIGNHEFDFGPAGAAATPSLSEHDPHGALKKRASEAQFPLLAANLMDLETGELVHWKNVHASVLIEVEGIKIGIIGVMTSRALLGTIAANVKTLAVAPLAPAIESHALQLRDSGAELVLVTAHAGGDCSSFEDPNDLSSCRNSAEIFSVARALPPGLVDHINAGHIHQGIAHIVNGIVITSSYSNMRAFSRVDFSIDRRSRQVTATHIFPPQELLADAEYEGQRVLADPDVVAIAAQAVQQAKERRETKLGIRLESAFTLDGNPESTLGNLFTDALLQSVDADIAFHNVEGGLRRDLPAGDLDFGSVYEMSPFENRVVVLPLSGAELRRVIGEQAHRRQRSIGFSGMRVFVSCSENKLSVDMRLADGRDIGDADIIKVIVNDYLALGGDSILTSIMPEGGYTIDDSLPLTRDVFISWLGAKGGAITASEYRTSATPKWNRPAPLPSGCRL